MTTDSAHCPPEAGATVRTFLYYPEGLFSRRLKAALPSRFVYQGHVRAARLKRFIASSQRKLSRKIGGGITHSLFRRTGVLNNSMVATGLKIRQGLQISVRPANLGAKICSGGNAPKAYHDPFIM